MKILSTRLLFHSLNFLYEEPENHQNVHFVLRHIKNVKAKQLEKIPFFNLFEQFLKRILISSRFQQNNVSSFFHLLRSCVALRKSFFNIIEKNKSFLDLILIQLQVHLPANWRMSMEAWHQVLNLCLLSICLIQLMLFFLRQHRLYRRYTFFFNWFQFLYVYNSLL